METRDIVPTYRVLTEPIYDLQIWFISLTWIETIVCASLMIMSWGLYDLIGLYNLSIFGIQFDSAIGGLITGLIAATIISILHGLRPEGSIEVYILGMVKPTKFIGRTEDKKWKPSLRPHWRKS